MPSMIGSSVAGMFLERRTDLDQGLIDEVLALADRTGDLGEAKRASLRVGVQRWTGVLAREDGRLLGYAHVAWGETDPHATVELAVADDTVAHRLLDAVRSLVAERGGGRWDLWVHEVADPADTVAADAGLSVQRDLAVMRRPLEQRPRVPAPAAGVVVRAYRPGVDDGELLRVNNAAFAGHPEQGGWDETTLAERRRLPWFDPDGVLLAWRGERALGLHWTKIHPGRVGEVYVIGVAPDAQGLGVGRTLLAAGLAHLHDRGCRAALLYVDRANTAAVRMYEADGFTIAHHEVCYEEVVPASSGSAVSSRAAVSSGSPASSKAGPPPPSRPPASGSPDPDAP